MLNDMGRNRRVSRVFLLCSVRWCCYGLKADFILKEVLLMGFDEWLGEVDRIFLDRFWIDHIMGGFSRDEMERDWRQGEMPSDWVQRVGSKYDLEECDEYGFKSFGF